ncbi:MAG: hypothetical protein MRY79_08710 [Alphaproteobacteria bacterium]|nr:hypothetical protein [Alphaproteobacteria bacterium]
MEADTIIQSSEWVNAGGLFLLIIGVSLLILEFFLPAFGLFGFAGVTGLLIGTILLHQGGMIDQMPVSLEVMMGLSILGLALSAAGGIYTWKLYKKKNTTGIEGMLGENVEVKSWKGQSGHVHIQGENWQGFCDPEFTFKKGDAAIVAKIDGLKIKIIPHHDQNKFE